MYNLIRVLFYILFFVTFSCTDEPVSVPQALITNPLDGKWDMISSVGGDFIPINESYEIGERNWSFDTTNNKILFFDISGFSCVVCNSERNYVIESDDINESVLKLADYDNDGVLLGTIPIGSIEELTQTSLIIKGTSVSPIVWTFVKSEEID